MRHLKTAALVAAATWLGGCGGGGSSSAPPAPTSYDGGVFYQQLTTVENTYTVQGTDSMGNVYRATVTVRNAGTGVFPHNGQTARQRITSGTTTINGTAQPTSPVTAWYDIATGAYLGSLSDGQCSAAANFTPIPEEVQVGDSAMLYTEAEYDGCGAANELVRTDYIWSLERIDGRVFGCLRSVHVDTDFGITTTVRECYEVAADSTLGEKARISYRFVGPGGDETVVLKNY